MPDQVMIIPAKLQAGDCIGVFSPAGPVRDRAKAEAGIRILREMGFRVKLNGGAGSGNGYLAADDQSRVDEFHTMLRDEEVKAMIALRGGYGCLRIADLLDYRLVETCRKFIIGFSDVSIMLNLISRRAGIVAVHGPVLTSLANTEKTSLHSLRSLLVDGLPPAIAPDDIVILRPGAARGILRGGNLATIVHLLGTPWEFPWTDTLLLLEDTGEPMYKIDRMLTQLHYSGRLAGLAGIILGGFDTGDDPGENRKLQEQVWQRVVELTADQGYPVWGNFPVGHREKNLALPLGLEISMDSSSRRLVLEQGRDSG
ncbi:MAG: LD-carboxypeptidase [Desulfobulbaceae bacterium]|nr:LD-carboxypeptidase [Desulfobulbaceae bacterium]